MAGRRLTSRLGAVLVFIVGALALGPVVAATAATPDGPTTITSPADSGTVTIRWHGTVTAGPPNLALRCFAPGLPADDFLFNLLGVSPSFYDTHKATLRIRVDWTPTAPNNTLNLTTYYTDNSGNITNIEDGIASGQDFQETTYTDPPLAAGTTKINANVCTQTQTAPQDYTGFATLHVLPIPPETAVTVGPQRLVPYNSPIENRDAAQRPNAGEPNIGADFETGKIMYMAGNQVSQITFNDAVSPPAATWKDVTPAQEPANEDQIIITDRATHRTWAAGLLIAGSNIQYSDDDGATWTQGTFPVPHSPDHETLGSGAYPASVTPGAYPRALYYCSQNIVQSAGAFCGVSTDGGTTYNPSVKIFGSGTPCGSIHGHVRVAPDGSAMVPQKQCGVGEGFALSRDLGQTWTYPIPPDSSSPGSSGSDPSVTAGARNTIYYAYSDGLRHPMVTISTDHGATWTRSYDLGAPFGIRASEFPEVVAGDDDRAAVAWIGSTARGDDQAAPDVCTEEFTPLTCSPNPDYYKGAWDLYVSYTYDRGASWQTTKVPGGPIQRGCVWLQGGGMPCRNMLDFNEITVDKQGRVLVSYTEGCTATAAYNCKTNANIDESGCSGSENAPFDSTATCTFARVAAVARQTCGKGLFAAYDGVLQGGCFTATTNSFNPNPVTGGDSFLPPTSAALTNALPAVPAWAVAVLPLGVVAVGFALKRRRRRMPPARG